MYSIFLLVLFLHFLLTDRYRVEDELLIVFVFLIFCYDDDDNDCYYHGVTLVQ